MSLIDELAITLNKSKDELINYSLVAPNKYKAYFIPKRRGGKRLIAQPTPELKAIQKYVISNKLNNLPIHDASFAYRKNINIKDNASLHVTNSYLLNLDLENFFNSITPYLFWMIFDRVCGEKIIDMSEREVYERFLFWKPLKKSKKLILSIGAPSSPFISNFILYELDTFLFQYCERKGITYSRYADDLTFSTNLKNNMIEIPEVVNKKLLELYNGFINLNKSKTIFSSKAKNRHVTGLVLTNDNKISIGRNKKRFVKGLIYRFKSNSLSNQDVLYLSGYLNYINYVEPEFINSLRFKYTANVIDSIMRFKNG